MDPHKIKPQKYKIVGVRLSDAQCDCLQAAARIMRRKTGEMVTVSKLLRHGAAIVAKQVGLTFPIDVYEDWNRI